MSFTLQHLRPYAARLAAYGLFVVFSVIFTMATALSVADFLRILFPQAVESVPTASASPLSQALQLLYAWLISFGPRRALLYFALIVFVLYGFKNLFSYLALIQMSVVRCKVVRNIRNQLFDKVMYLPLSYFGNHRTGDLLALFSGDVTEYDESSLASMQQFVVAIVSMVLYLAMLFYISVRLTIFVLCMLPIIVFVISGITHRLRRSSHELQERNAGLASLMEETIMGLKVIKSYTAIDFSNNRFQQADSQYALQRTKVLRRVDLSSPVSDFLGNCVVIGILLFGSYMVIGQASATLTPDLFVSYIMLFVLMIPPAKELSSAVSLIKKGRACSDRLQSLLAEPDVRTLLAPANRDLVPSCTDADSNIIPCPKLSVQNVTFHYNLGVDVLSDVSFSIPVGATVALVGSSGSGKSTIADLLMRFYDCASGDILLDGISLRQLSLNELRRRVCIVSQHTMLFNDTIRSNIAFGRPDADEKQILRAAQVAQAHEFIMQQPQGYDTCIGDSGVLLSGGQRQRLSIARALLCDPELLILDEATSALDTQSEHLVQQALDTLRIGRTTLVIAHRLSTICDADLILVLEQGHIVERGTHFQLLAVGGRYSQLIHMQTIQS